MPEGKKKIGVNSERCNVYVDTEDATDETSRGIEVPVSLKPKLRTRLGLWPVLMHLELEFLPSAD